MLQLSSVAKTYPGGVHALRDIDLHVPKGLFGLLGPNGAGKSTLMRTIATLQAPDAGTVTFDGLDVLRVCSVTCPRNSAPIRARPPRRCCGTLPR